MKHKRVCEQFAYVCDLFFSSMEQLNNKKVQYLALMKVIT